MAEAVITNSELMATFREVISEARAAVVAANAAAASANAAAVQASGGAAAGVAGARTQSNVESDTQRALGLIQQQVESDIDTPEAWKANVKRTYDIHQSDEREAVMRNRIHFDSMITQLNTHLAELNHLALQSLANNQNQSNLNNTLSIDRSWNINETDLSAKSAAVLTDSILAKVAVAPRA